MTDDRIKELANKWNLYPTDHAWDEVMGFAYDLLAEEREACARICDDQSDKDGFEGGYANECAERIRARGNHD